MEHDRERLHDDLKECLSLGKQRIAVLIGAGCPTAVRVTEAGSDGPLIPAMLGLTDEVSRSLGSTRAFKTLLKEFKDDGEVQPNVEDMLSRLRRLSSVVGKGSARGLRRADIDLLERQICTEITRVVRRQLPSEPTPYHKFARWAKAGARSEALRIFTTNYDLLMEEALEANEVRYFDGFIGTNKPFFDGRAIEEDGLPSTWARFWKLHGSINWVDAGAERIVRGPVPADGAAGMLIYPSEFKHEQTRRLPYVAMLDRLRAFLNHESSVLVTCGYSFADRHLNDAIFDALHRNRSAAAYGLLFKKLDEESAVLGEVRRAPVNISFLARDEAVVRGKRARWKPPEPGAATATTEFALGDFGAFAEFLNVVAG